MSANEHYQLVWETVPGLRGLHCEGFRLQATAAPTGLAVSLAHPEQGAALIAALERTFAQRWFSNAAAAFEAVKEFAVQWVLAHGAPPTDPHP